MRSSRWQLILVALVAALAGFSLGCFVTSSKSGPEMGPASVPGTATTNPSPSNPPSTAPANGMSALVREAGTPADGNQAAVARFWTTLTMPDEHARFAAWIAQLQEMNAANALEVRGLFLKMDKQGRWFIPEWDAFWPRWGEVDGPAALKNLDETIGMEGYRPSVAEKILRGWSKTNPAAARAWVEANASSPLFDGALRGYLDGLGRTNLEKATQDALSLGKGRLLTGAMEVLAEQALQQRQMGGLLDWWRSLPEDPSADGARYAATSAIYTRMQRGDDSRTQQWLTELAATPYRNDGVIQQFVTKLGEKDPAAAVQWAAQLAPTPGDGRFVGIGTAVPGLAQRDPRALESWLNQLPPSSLRDQAVAAYTVHLERAAGESTAAQWRAQIQDPRWVPRVPK